MHDCYVRIGMAENGFTLETRDPEIMKKNMDDDGPYKDPERKYVFSTMEDLKTFLSDNLDTMLVKTKDEYGSSFNAAVKQED